MRPLTHPSIDDVTVEGILHALSDPVRATIYWQLSCADSANTCSAFLKLEDRCIPKSTLSQHFRALREAGLVHSERRGVEMLNTTRCAEIEERFPGLLPAIKNAQSIQCAASKQALAARDGAAKTTRAG
ncbi:helix-turn-helix domain-containing protein [Dyella sp. C11]|uniref:ArsR/SmtB family transcription factor n=1 Tax=Dyella sp. C11 TaxID=2126991 RepID=UPI000D658448|nr:helix-turn-helix domain-containing protein [Dyella sp. C11]